MVGVQPAEQFTGQRSLIRMTVDELWIFEHLNGLFGPRDHLLPVLDRLFDEPQDLQQPLLQFRNKRLATLRARGRQDFQMHP